MCKVPRKMMGDIRLEILDSEVKNLKAECMYSLKTSLSSKKKKTWQNCKKTEQKQLLKFP